MKDRTNDQNKVAIMRRKLAKGIEQILKQEAFEIMKQEEASLSEMIEATLEALTHSLFSFVLNITDHGKELPNETTTVSSLSSEQEEGEITLDLTITRKTTTTTTAH